MSRRGAVSQPIEGEKMEYPDCGALDEAQVKEFFREHPVHRFGKRTIETYLDLDAKRVDAALSKLVRIGFIKETYELSPAAKDELIAEGGR